MFVSHGLVEPRLPLAQARVLVAGLGVTGRACLAALAGRCASLLVATGHNQTVDISELEALAGHFQALATEDSSGQGSGDQALREQALPAGWISQVVMPDTAQQAEQLLASVDLVVTSPGIRPSHLLLTQAVHAGIPVWSEPELAWRLRVPRASGGGPAPWLGVTGTNGKTSTVLMMESMLTAAGLRTRAVGNVGSPLIQAAMDPHLDVLAVELSSFQLHFTHTVSLQASTVLNLAEDHLDWHGDMDNYGNDKGRIFEHVQRAGVYNVSDPITRRLLEEANVTEGAIAAGFTLAAPSPGQLGLVEDILVDRAFHAPADAPDRQHFGQELATLADLTHLGSPPAPHTLANALAAAGLVRAHGVQASAIAQGLRDFQPGAHRIAAVAVIDSVTYVNDSKATNAHAAGASLAAYQPGTVVWVCGGLAKGAQFDDLLARQAGQLRAAVVIGTDQRPYRQALARHAPAIPCVSIDPGDTEVMQSAVQAAQALAQPGDTVLLAPAGASMDQFTSYAHRGDAFTQAVQALQGRHRTQ